MSQQFIREELNRLAEEEERFAIIKKKMDERKPFKSTRRHGGSKAARAAMKGN